MAKILIVDDLPVNRQFLVTLLGYVGHQLVEASDGAEALELARAERPDLVITDILMPTMDGPELVLRLRAVPELAPVPVIFYTAAYSAAEARNMARSCGAGAVLAKPVSPELILEAVNAALGPAKAALTPHLPADLGRGQVLPAVERLPSEVLALETVSHRLAGLIEITSDLALERDPARLVERFCHGARKLVGAKHAAAGILTEGGQVYQHLVSTGRNLRATAQGRPVAGILGRLLQERRPVRLRDVGSEELGVAATPGSSRVSSFLGVPILSPASLHGWLCLTDKLGSKEFSDDDERLSVTLAAQVGGAYENVCRYDAIQREMAERRRVEASRNLLASIVESSDDAIIGKTLHGIIVTWNRGAERVYGYAADEVKGKSVSILIPPDFRDEMPGILEKLRWGKGIDHYETVRVRKDGRRIDVSITVSPLRDAAGRVIGGSAIARDITDHKRAEDQIRSSLREKEALLKEVHHRVKNNLQAICSLLRLQSGCLKDPQALAVFEESQNRVKSMALVHEKLYESKDLGRIDFAEYLRSLIASLSRSYRAEAVTLQTRAQDVFLEIGMAIPCGLIINELVSNSLKHGFPSGQRGNLSVEVTRNNHQVTLAVRDDGCGFPEQLDYRRPESLGLQLVHTFAEQLGGTLEMRSEGGTEFRITFADSRP